MHSIILHSNVRHAIVALHIKLHDAVVLDAWRSPQKQILVQRHRTTVGLTAARHDHADKDGGGVDAGRAEERFCIEDVFLAVLIRPHPR